MNNQGRERIVIFGASIRNFSTNYICFQKKNVNSGRARSNHFRGATSEDLSCYVDARLQEAAYVAAIIHAGVNDILTHLFPMYPFSAPWKHQKTWRFSDVFKG